MSHPHHDAGSAAAAKGKASEHPRLVLITTILASSLAFVDGPDGSSAFRDVPRFADPNAVAHAGSLLAPMPGTVIRVLAGTGDAVTAGAALVVLEAMKMEHTVAAPVDGVVGEMHVAPGDQVETRQVLAVVEEPEEAAS